MKRLFKLVFVIFFLCTFFTGCTHYLANRSADFRDMFTLSAGITRENPETILSPSLGVHVQVTEFLQVGALHFTGLSAEVDGRGLSSGPESRTKFSFIAPLYRNIKQDYERGARNYFKLEDSLWRQRMHGEEMSNSSFGWPAKNLIYQDDEPRNIFKSHNATPHSELYFDRGWQHWANMNIELAIADPIFHWGFKLKFGFDWSEFSDFVLGIFTLDVLKGDDMTREEYKEYRTSRRQQE